MLWHGCQNLPEFLRGVILRGNTNVMTDKSYAVYLLSSPLARTVFYVLVFKLAIPALALGA